MTYFYEILLKNILKNINIFKSEIFNYFIFNIDLGSTPYKTLRYHTKGNNIYCYITGININMPVIVYIYIYMAVMKSIIYIIAY